MKRIVAWMLICILLIGLLSVVVCAADVDSPEDRSDCAVSADRREWEPAHGSCRNDWLLGRGGRRFQEIFCQINSR